MEDDPAERKNVSELYRLLVERLKANGFQALCERAARDPGNEIVIAPWMAVLSGGRAVTVEISSLAPPGDGLEVWIGALDVNDQTDGAARDDLIHQAIHSPVDIESVMGVIRIVMH